MNDEITRKIDRIVIHCSDSPQGRGDNAKTIDSWHKQRGWSGIGYHYVILEDGTIEVGRDLNRSGAHAKGYNRKSIGICLIGKDSFTDKQFMALSALTIGLKKQFKVDNNMINGHYQLSSKTCPNFDVPEFIQECIVDNKYKI